MRYLLVEDDPFFAELICQTLAGEKLQVDWVEDGGGALAAAAKRQYDGFIIDMVLPDISGLELIAALRERGIGAPIMSLSGLAGTKVLNVALDAGADDYLRKPFDLELLTAKMRALSRRCGIPRCDELIKFGDLTLNSASYLVMLGGEEILLRAKEFDILRILMLNPGKLMSSRHIIEKLFIPCDGARSNFVEVHIHSLRKKLKSYSIENVRGEGFRLSATSSIPKRSKAVL